MSEQESFWNAGSFAVITDKTKPAMKWTIDELTKREKKVYVVDMSDKPDKGALQDISELPPGVDCAVIGVTRMNPANAMEGLEKKNINKFWIHWMTETPEVEKRREGSQIQCITGRCPMMYLGHGINIHTLHRSIAKLMGKY
jgi:predicted CoA-binding protein